MTSSTESSSKDEFGTSNSLEEGGSPPMGPPGDAAAATTRADASSSSPPTPWIAIADGDLPRLQALLMEQNLDLNAADENGYTLLQAAASYSHLEILQWLWQVNQHPHDGKYFETLSVNAVDEEGDTALHYASTVEAAQFLVEQAHLDPHIRNQQGFTALESKQYDLQEMVVEAQEEDEGGELDESDEEVIALRALIAYLSTL